MPESGGRILNGSFEKRISYMFMKRKSTGLWIKSKKVGIIHDTQHSVQVPHGTCL